MTTDTVPQTVLLPDLFDKPVVAKFEQEQARSDGGAILLKAADRVYGLVKAFAQCLVDKRAPDKIRHSLVDLIGQRVFGIACGHPDRNDGDRLAEDPIHKLLLDRDPVSGERLASQPTLSRFKNAVSRSALYRLGCELAGRVVERHRRRLDGRARTPAAPNGLLNLMAPFGRHSVSRSASIIASRTCSPVAMHISHGALSGHRCFPMGGCPPS